MNAKNILRALFCIAILIIIKTVDLDFSKIYKQEEIKTEDVRKRMKRELKEKYGEEFVVDAIGLREANGEKFYQAQIYPQSIIGTSKENELYYYKRASIEVSNSGKLQEGVADTYGEVMMNNECENYLMPRAKKIFGKKILIEPQVEYHRLNKNDTYVRYFVSGFKEKLTGMTKKKNYYPRKKIYFDGLLKKSR